MNRSTAMSMAILAITLGACSTTQTSTEYKGAQARADQDYMLALRKCEALTGDAKSLCQVEAKAAEMRAVAEAKAKYVATTDAVIQAQKDKVAADHIVAREKCNSFGGDAKRACIAEAKTVRDGAIDEIDAVARRQEAEWKAAVAQCNELGGTYRATCMAEARAKHGR